MTKLEALTCDYWIENTDKIYNSELHISDPIMEAFEAGFIKARHMATKLADNSPFNCQCASHIEDMGKEDE